MYQKQENINLEMQEINKKIDRNVNSVKYIELLRDQFYLQDHIDKLEKMINGEDKDNLIDYTLEVIEVLQNNLKDKLSKIQNGQAILTDNVGSPLKNTSGLIEQLTNALNTLFSRFQIACDYINKGFTHKTPQPMVNTKTTQNSKYPLAGNDFITTSHKRQSNENHYQNDNDIKPENPDIVTFQ